MEYLEFKGHYTSLPRARFSFYSESVPSLTSISFKVRREHLQSLYGVSLIDPQCARHNFRAPSKSFKLRLDLFGAFFRVLNLLTRRALVLGAFML